MPPVLHHLNFPPTLLLEILQQIDIIRVAHPYAANLFHPVNNQARPNGISGTPFVRLEVESALSKLREFVPSSEAASVKRSYRGMLFAVA